MTIIVFIVTLSYHQPTPWWWDWKKENYDKTHVYIYMAQKCSFPHLGLAAFFCTDPDQKSSPTIMQCHDSSYLQQQCESMIPPIFPSLTMHSIRTILKSILPPPFRGSLKTPQLTEIPVSRSPAARPQPESLRTESQGEPESNVYPGTVSPQRLLESRDRDSSSHNVEYLLFLWSILIWKI